MGAKGRKNKIKVVFTPTTIEKDDFISIKFPENNVMRIESGRHGLIRVFPLLLERFAGVRYVFPTNKGTHFPKTKDFIIPVKSFSFQPFFRFNRKLTWDWVTWENKLGRKTGVKCDHNIPKYIIPISQYIKSGRWPAPDVFPVVKGKRLNMQANPDTIRYSKSFQSDWQPCFTSQASVNEAVKNIEAWLAAHPEENSISLTPNDGAGYCECAECKKLDNRKRTAFKAYKRYVDHANSYYHWCNAVIKRVIKKYPDIYFGSLAYRETHYAPDIKIDPHMLIYVCIDFGWAVYPDIFPKLKKDIEQWVKTGATLGVWEYNWGDSSYTLPHYYPNTVARMIRLLADNKYQAFFGEGCESAGEGPKRYIYLKLLENPYRDVEEIKKEWFEACVGEKAAPYLAEYFDFWENFWIIQASKTAHSENRKGLYQPLNDGFGPYMNGLRKGDMPKLRKLMEKVVALTGKFGDSRQKIRAEWLMYSFEYYELCAITWGSGILPYSGAVETIEQAIELLETIPAAVEAHKKRIALLKKLSVDPNLKWWWGIRRMSQKKAAPQYEYMLTKCAVFASVPEVQVRFKDIVKNKKLPITLRLLANTILKTSKARNILLNTPGFSGFSNQIHTVKLPVSNNEWLHNIPAKFGKYLVSAKIEIPKNAVITADTWLNMRLQGRNKFLKPAGGFSDSPKIKPRPGGVYTLTHTYELKEKNNAKYLQFIINLFNFKKGTKVKISEISITRL
jgi:hypothetical protein